MTLWDHTNIILYSAIVLYVCCPGGVDVLDNRNDSSRSDSIDNLALYMYSLNYTVKYLDYLAVRWIKRILGLRVSAPTT